MADIKTDDLFLVNRSGKSGNATFDMIQASVLAGNLYIESSLNPPEDVSRGMIWVKLNDDGSASLEIAYGNDYLNPDFRPLDTGSSVTLGDSTDTAGQFNPLNYEDGDLFYDDVLGKLFIKSGSDWNELNSIGSLSNVDAGADTASRDGEFLEYNTSTGKYHASGRSVPEYIYDLEDVYTDEFPPKDGDSLVFFDDVYEGGAASKDNPGWKPSEVKGGGIQLTPKLTVSLEEQTPNVRATGTPRFTEQKFDVEFTPQEPEYEYGSYKVRARVNGEYQEEEVIEPPDADMTGLRFDTARTPSLQRTFDSGNQKTFSWSGWVKNCGKDSSQQVIFSAHSGSGDKYSSIDFKDNNLRFIYYPGGGGAELRTKQTFYNPSEWIHVVLAVDTTQASDSDRVKLYINGVEPDLSVANYPAQDAEVFFSGAQRHLFGLNANSISPNGPYNGYLSDVYFVDDKALEPTVFGHDYNGTWGPKDSADVVSAVGDFGLNGFYLSFDPDQTGAEYTASLTGDFQSGKGAERGFDGNLSNSVIADSGDITFTVPDGINGELEVYTSVAGQEIKLNGSQVTASSDSGWNTVGNVAAGNTVTVSASLEGFKLDGTLLINHSSIGVDSSLNGNNFHDSNFGVGNTSQYFSNLLDNESGFDIAGGYPLKNAFDGSLTTWTRAQSNNTPATSYFEPVSGTEFVIYGCLDTQPGSKISVRSGGTGASGGGWVDVTSYFTANNGEIERVDISAAGIDDISGFELQSNSDNPRIAAIEVDGVMLVDPFSADQVADTPMQNFAVLKSGGLEIGNGGLAVANGSGGGGVYTSLQLPDTGKYYFEAYATTNENVGAGVLNGKSMGNPGAGPQAGMYGIFSKIAGAYFRYDHTSDTDTKAVAKAGDYLGIAVDMDTKHITLYKNGGNIDDFTMTSTDDGKGYYFVAITGNAPNRQVPVNFGQQKFVMDPPAGYSTLYKELTVDVIKRASEETDALWAKFTIDAGRGVITGLSETPTEYVEINGTGETTFVLEFPDTFGDGFGNGQSPDDTLISGTGLTVETTYLVEGELEGNQVSNTVIPQDPDTEPDEPDYEVPEMSGLRFDENRKTRLENTLALSDTFTVSFWAKIQERSGGAWVFQTGSGSNKLGIFLGGDDTLAIYQNATQTRGSKANFNKWVHLVLTCDGSDVTLYRNGVLDVKDSLTVGFGNQSFTIGGPEGNGQYNGYASDFYFADGKVLPASAFAYTGDSGRWTPLESDVVRENLNKAQPADPTPEPGPGAAGQPYDSRANTSEVWSAKPKTGTDYAGASVTLAFDGQLTTGEWFGVADSLPTLTLDLAAQKSIRIYGKGGTGSGIGWSLYIDGGEVPINFGTNVLRWIDAKDFGVNFPCTLTSIANTSFNGGIAAVEVDGRLLVDQGVWDVSKNWSDYVTTNGTGFQDQRGPHEAFNGVPGASNNQHCQAAGDENPSTITFTPEGGIAYTSNVEVWVINNENVVSFNGGGGQSVAQGGWAEVASGTGTLNTIVFTRNNEKGASFAGIRVDGVELVDGGAQWNNSENWSENVSGKYDTRGYSPAQAFNGELGGKGWIPFGDPASVWTPTTSLTGISTFRIYGQRIDNAGNTIKVTQTDNSVVDISSQVSATRDWQIITGVTSIKSIEVKGVDESSNIIQIDAFEIDGAILVDGTAVWNTDQVWSEDNTAAVGFYYSSSGYYGGPENAFNGSLANYCLAGTGVGVYNTGVYAPSPTIAFNTLRICVEQEGTGSLWVDTGSGLVDVTADLVLTGNKGVYTTSTPGTLNRLEYRSSAAGNYCALGSVEINGEVLVDAAPTWNSSKVWSGSLIASDGFGAAFPATQGFDGILSPANQAQTIASNQTLTWTFEDGLTGPVRVWIQNNGGTVTDGSGNVLATIATGTNGWVELTGNIETYGNTIIFDGGGVNSSSFAGIEVNGELLVDGGFGPSGFYLSFDPTQTGANYSSTTELSGDLNPSFNNPAALFDNTFDGSSGSGRVVGVATKTMIIEFGRELSGNIAFWLRSGASPGADTFSYSLDGGSNFVDADITAAGGKGAWVDLGNITITEAQGIQWKNAAAGNSVIICGVKVDGAVLVDHTSIGVDMSGNNNDFCHSGFFVGSDNSQTWSDDLTGDSIFNGAVTDCFDGDILNTKLVASGDIVFTPTGGLTGVESLVLYTERKPEVTVVGNLGTKTYTGDLAGTSEEFVIPLGGVGPNITSITIGKGSYTYGYLYGIVVNGELLTDAVPLASDQVLDTPTKDYPVLDPSSDLGASGSLINGNLTGVLPNGKAKTTLDLPASGKFYYEYTLLSTYTDTHGGRMGINTALDNASFTGIYATDSGDGGIYENGSKTQALGDQPVVGDVFGFALDMDALTLQVFKNGSAAGTAASFTSGSYFPYVAGNGSSGTLTTIHAVNFGQQDFVYGTKDDDAGTVTVGGVTYQQLFTKSSLPSGRISRDTFVGVQNAIQQFKSDVATRRESLKTARSSARTKLLALGLTEDEVTALSAEL